mmetsp:Transcript_14583/g.23744  ORF Transcript_14583/g.23744 Transcript_14583/m.23744 type:complete len:90 (-) Transcript_14583:1916-2185(-)
MTYSMLYDVDFLETGSHVFGFPWVGFCTNGQHTGGYWLLPRCDRWALTVGGCSGKAVCRGPAGFDDMRVHVFCGTSPFHTGSTLSPEEI